MATTSSSVTLVMTASSVGEVTTRWLATGARTGAAGTSGITPVSVDPEVPQEDGSSRPDESGRERGEFTDRIGSAVGGYLLEEVVGSGGMGVVYRARQGDTGRLVALKLMLPEVASNHRFRERFILEAKVAPQLEHPHIVPVFDVGESCGQLFIAMRLVEGPNLKEIIDREGALEPSRALRVIAQAAAALDHAHGHGMIHRDVKPQNLLLTEFDNNVEHVYLTDFGLVKPTSTESTASRTSGVFGSIQYMSPEQIEGMAIDGRADVYSLACVAFECLTARPPFERPNEIALLWAHVHEEPPRPSDVLRSLPGGLDLVLRQAMSKHPDDRYLTCGEFVEALEEGARQHRGRLVAPAMRPLVGRIPRPKTEREVWAPNFFPEISRVRKLTDRTNWVQVIAVTSVLALLAAALVQFSHPQGLGGAVSSVGSAVAQSVKSFIEPDPGGAMSDAPGPTAPSDDEQQRSARMVREPLSTRGPRGSDAQVPVLSAPKTTRNHAPPGPAAPQAEALPGSGRIVFASNRDRPSNFDLYLTTNGSELTRLTSGSAQEWNPEWSPDGSKIMFTGCSWNPFCDIYTIRPDGTELSRLTTDGKSDSAVWSPDGRKIAFAVRSGGNGSEDIYVMNADGSGIRQLTDDPRYEDDPTWSPDGRRIAFHRGGDIYVMNADGSGIRPLLATPEYDGFPVWSPKGDRICFESTRDGDFDIWTVLSDGSTLEKVTKDGRHDPLDDFWCNWSPDGNMLSFVSGPDGSSGLGGKIFISSAQGANERLLTVSGASDFDPDWEPLRDQPG